MPKIKLSSITKRYKNLLVLDDISYEFNLGKAYLLIGANGSGKSTLIKILLGLVKYDGVITNIDDLKISYIPESINFPDYISIYRFLENLGNIKKIDNLNEKIDHLLHEWDLYHSKDKLIHQLSKGMKQKLLIINALLDDCDLYIFDEPLNGLDINNQNIFLKKLQELKNNNKTIIISTHYIGFYKMFNDVVLEITNGKLYETAN